MSGKMNKYQVRDLMKEMLLDSVIEEVADNSRHGDTQQVKHWATELVRITDLIDPDAIEAEFISYLRIVVDFNDELYDSLMKTFSAD